MTKYLSISTEHAAIVAPMSLTGRFLRGRRVRGAIWTMGVVALLSSVIW
ncbi:hypothetical protein [Neorhizobium sp. P12A]|nr:hypothetical protein [Neorhizobium sp. P12A]